MKTEDIPTTRQDTLNISFDVSFNNSFSKIKILENKAVEL